MDQESLCLLIRHKIQDGHLPHDSITRVWSGPSDGETCAACGTTLSKDQVLVGGEPPWRPATRPFRFHVRCFQHNRRALVHVNVTDHPTAAWTAHQLVESFPEETAPKYLLRDRDAIYGDVFVRRVTGLGISEILIAPRAPCQNPFAQRVIRPIPRECLDHVNVVNER